MSSISSTPRLQSLLNRLSHLPQALQLIWQAARVWTLAWVILLIAQGLLPAATVYLTRLLVNRLVTVMGTGGGWVSLQPVLLPALLMAGLLLLKELLQSVIEWVRTAQAELIQDHISALVHQKSVEVDLSFYESPEYHDHLHRARDDASIRPLNLLESLGSLLQDSITFLAIAIILIPYGAWLPLVLLISTLPAFYVVLRFSLRHHQWWHQTTSDRRWTYYYDFMLTDGKAAPELRLFGLGTHFMVAYQRLRRRLRVERLQLARHQSLSRLGAGTIALVISSAALAWIGWRALQGKATLGDLALFYQAFNQGQSLMRSLLGSVGQIYSNSLFLGNLFEFLNLAPQIVDAPNPLPAPSVLRQGIQFRQVTFYYPGSQRVALQNFNLTIPAGQTVAIVGANGAGKSTLVKLLCRFYDPESGSIELDGIDMRNLSLKQLRRLIAVLFQSPIEYHATVAENIALGDLDAAPPPAEITTAAQGSGAYEVVTRLPQGFKTLLGKWFVDGTDLSGGEWQRVALARAFVRQAQVLVLDEPTSAMDSWAEADWLKRFRRLVRGRTAIIITHRFTTAMQADVIHVMHRGQIVESGSHQQLLSQGGLYAQSWKAQMQASPNNNTSEKVYSNYEF